MVITLVMPVRWGHVRGEKLRTETATLNLGCSNFRLIHQVRGPKIKMIEMKTTSNGRRPQNIKRWIFQQPLIRSSSNFKLKLRGPNQNQKCLKWRRPPMEDDIKILKVEYLSNHWSDLPQILNWSSEDQTKML